ncbi:MAG: hypothetical protein Q4F05_14750 [bacterium]|nr:hypothetical protein [bacterium]
MAKNVDEEFEFDDSMEDESKGSKVLSVIIGIIIFLILMALLAGFIKLDIGGVGSNVLYPYLKNIPVVNQILPDRSDELLALENGYKFDNISEAVAYIQQLEAKVKTLEETNAKDSSSLSDLQAEVERLKVFENEQDAFNERVLEFDTNVVFNEKAPDITEYQAYYEGISPDNAAEIYRQVIEQAQASELVKEQAQRYAKMDPKAAASALEVMTADLDLVSDILRNMSTAKAALIMDEMSADYCAKVTKKMSLFDASK